MMDNIGYGWERMEDIIEQTAEEEAKEQQKDDHEQYDTVPAIKLVYEGARVKEFRVTGNLNNANTKIIV